MSLTEIVAYYWKSTCNISLCMCICVGSGWCFFRFEMNGLSSIACLLFGNSLILI